MNPCEIFLQTGLETVNFYYFNCFCLIPLNCTSTSTSGTANPSLVLQLLVLLSGLSSTHAHLYISHWCLSLFKHLWVSGSLLHFGHTHLPFLHFPRPPGKDYKHQGMTLIQFCFVSFHFYGWRRRRRRRSCLWPSSRKQKTIILLITVKFVITYQLGELIS